MAPRRPNPDTLARRVERYRDAPDDAPAAAQLGRRLWAGEEITGADAGQLGRTSSLVSVLVADFERAGYRVARRRTPGGGNAVAYALDDHERHPTPATPPRAKRRALPRHPTRDSALERNVGGAVERVEPVFASNGARAPVYAHEVPGITYPALGALLGVRAVALVDGELVLHLGDGAGVWQVRVTGHAPG